MFDRGPTRHAFTPPSRALAATAVATALALSLAAHHASACTRDAGTLPTCRAGAPAFAEGATVPANVPALPFYVGWNSGPIELRAASGERIPVTPGHDSLGRAVITPSAALVPDTQYTIHYGGDCPPPGADAGPDAARTFGFETGPNVPLPTTIGMVTVETFVSRESYPASGTCAPPVELRAANARFRIDPSPELRAYLPVAVLEAVLDGTVSFGTAGGADGLTIHGRGVPCESSPSTPHSWPAAPGRHSVEIRAHVPGAVTDPAPVRLEVTLACDGPVAPSDAGGVDAGADDGGAASHVPSGCAVGPGRARPRVAGLALALALALALLSLCRRRRDSEGR